MLSGAFGDAAARLRQRYPGPDGRPSEAAYLCAEGIAPAPGSETYAWQVVFKLAYRAEDLARLERAEPVALDCYLVRTRAYRAPWRATPVWDGRVYEKDGALVVAAYTRHCEQVVGRVGEQGIEFETALGADQAPLLGLEDLRYNPFSGQLWRRERGGRIEEDQRFYLPLPLVNASGEAVRCVFDIVRRGSRFALVARAGETEIVLATCRVNPDSIMSRTPGYSPRLGPGCIMPVSGPTEILEVRGEFAPGSLDLRGADLVVAQRLASCSSPKPQLRIDGDFSEWRNIPGVADPAGDTPGYLDYNADTDFLQFKVANDERHLYFYTRVAGRHGNCAPGDDRYYYYVYIDADRDPATGYLPTRDDDCYYGVAIGDDCEAQFEFIGGRFIKTFFGFTGAGTEKEVLAGRVTLGPSWYSKYDESGRPRDRYKVEYVRRGGNIYLTGDYLEGTSDDIIIALSPDGSECEMRVELAGFLRDPSGRQIIAPGQRIDLAVGAEASGSIHGNTRWSADSTAPIYGYRLAPR